MKDEPTEYRFAVWGARGQIVLGETEVTCDTTSHLGRWKTSTPYGSIQPHPIYVWHTPPGLVYVALGVAFIGFTCGLAGYSDLQHNDWSLSVSSVFLLAMAVSLFALLVRVVRTGKTEWIMFPTRIEGHWVSYARTGSGAQKFDEFTLCLESRIEAARLPGHKA